MSSYKVLVAFTAFQRDYKSGETLADGDLLCWQPDDAREAMIDTLMGQGKIETADIDDPAAKYPAVWGGAPSVAEPAPPSPPPEQ